MEITRIAIVGAGQMGGGIAQVAAQSGLDVVLLDASPAFAEKGKAKIAASLEKLVAKGKMAADAKDATLARITVGQSYDDAKDAHLAIEAIVENEAVKRETFQKLDAVLGPDAILASNTSSISITRLAAATKRPAKFIGMHFFNPVPVMQLVELIRGAATSDETEAAIRALATKMGKTVAASKDMPGFIVNRILIPMINEACFALHEGLGTAKDIDAAMKLGCNMPMGPLELADFIGLDTCLSIAEVLHRGLGEDKYRPSPLLRQYVDAGWLGRKSGRGFHTY